MDKEHSVNLDMFQSLRCVVLPGQGRFCQPRFYQDYIKAYHFWKRVRGYALFHESKLDADKATLCSDEFRMQAEIACLFDNRTAIACFMFNWFDLNLVTALDSSYFKAFPLSAREKIQSLPHRYAMVMSHLTVDPSWRRSKIGVGMADILTRFATLRFQSSQANILLVNSRNDRSTDRLFYAHGGHAIEKNYHSHGIASDIIYMEKKHIKPPKNKALAEIATILWCKREQATIVQGAEFILVKNEDAFSP